MKAKVRARKFSFTIKYVPHKVIADYNATYNVRYKGQHIITEAAKRLSMPLNEIWISELWKPYEEYVLFHELQEINHRRDGLSPDQAHRKAIEDTPKGWIENPEFHRMVSEIQKMDAETARRKRASVTK